MTGSAIPITGPRERTMGFARAQPILRAECGWRARTVLSAPASPTGVFIFRSTMSNSDAPSRHHRKPGNDDAELHSRDATGIRVFCRACQESLPRTDGRRCVCSPKREAERRTAHQFQLPRLDGQARPRPDKRDRSPFGAPPRSCAGSPDSARAALPGITGCKREDPLRHQCSEHLAVRHAPDGLMPKPPAG
jgi:hypothetical protein